MIGSAADLVDSHKVKKYSDSLHPLMEGQSCPYPVVRFY